MDAKENLLNIPNGTSKPTRMTKKKMMAVVCNSLQEMEGSQGVSVDKVYKYMQSRYGNGGPLSKGKLEVAIKKAVRDGYLISRDGKYYLNITTARGRCGCKATRKKNACTNRKSLIKRLMKMLFKKKRCMRRKPRRRAKCRRRRVKRRC